MVGAETVILSVGSNRRYDRDRNRRIVVCARFNARVSQVDGLLKTLNSEALLQLGQFMEFGRVISFSVVVGVIEIVLMTAFGALMALIYNVVAMLVGGLHVTVTDE